VPFEFPSHARVAVIGGGVTGLSAAYHLSSSRPVTLFEAEARLGGHARTVMAGRSGQQPVDTGFIVFNRPNYPTMTALFDALDVPVKPSNMSFAASIDDGRVEYAINDLKCLLGQSHNLVKPAFWKMMADLFRFHREAIPASQDPDMTVGEMLDGMKLGDWFRRYYLLPISGAIWSATPEQMADFPARTLVQFFENHALLQVNTHKWETVAGGSIEYVRRMEAAMRAQGVDIRTGAPVAAVRRDVESVAVRAVGGDWEEFDQVLFACHSDDALRLLSDATTIEQSVLGRMRYHANRGVLHRDATQMPRRRSCWASWVFKTADATPRPQIGLTYWMNSLQGIDPGDPLFLSLNPEEDIPDEAIYDTWEMRHPVFDRPAIAAQAELAAMQGENRSWFCGAYTRYGFHEDGFASGLNAARRISELEEVA
jgi:predicted NAD/FAD-binding protein